MTRFFTLFVLLASATTGVFAQKPAILQIAAQTSTGRLKSDLYYLASDSLEGRLMASHGDTLASLFVAAQFRQAHLDAPYDKGQNYFQPIVATRRTTVKEELRINGKTYGRWDGWLSQGGSIDVPESPVVYIGTNSLDSFYGSPARRNINGKVIIIPVRLLLEVLRGGKMDSFLSVLSHDGVRLVLFRHPNFDGALAEFKANDFLPNYVDSIYQEENMAVPVISLSAQRYTQLLAGGDPADIKSTIAAQTVKENQKVIAPNVIGVIRGSDPAAPCVIISAHHDHEGRNGNIIYYGAVDNASGTVALLEIARLMDKAVKAGFRPKRTIVFASYTGEERGLLGSSFYSQHPVYPIGSTRAVINIDMLGRVDTFYSGRRADSNYAYILVKDSLDRGLRKALYKANASPDSLKLDTYYEQPQYATRRITGSDQYPFYLKGVPFIRIDCGFTKDYHQPTDTPDKINYGLLTRQTRLAFLALWNVAND